MKNSEKQIRRVYALSVVLGCAVLLVFALLVTFAGIRVLSACLLCVFLYLLLICYFARLRREKQKEACEPDSETFLDEHSGTVFAECSYPVFVFDDAGTVLWYNAAAARILPEGESMVRRHIGEIFGDIPDTSVQTGTLTVGNLTYSVEAFPFADKGLTLMMLSDITKLDALRKKYEDERVAVAYLAIDNVEDVLQYVHEQFRGAVSAVDDRLKEWARQLHGVIKSYDNDKYIMFFDSACLDACIRDRFSILDEIRSIRLGDGVSVTVSIGVSRMGDTLAERETAAREAIDLALQRGGDQAVFRCPEGTEYYGGRTKSVYRRSNVRSRTFTNQLTAMMARADNVLIMGHRYGDFDSFGACVGLCSLARRCGARANIAVDLHDANLQPCIRMMRTVGAYAQTFVDAGEALSLVKQDTLLIIADVNTLARTQFPNLADRVQTIVIVDHHRKIDKVDDKVKLSYVEPSASSACELVTEMLQTSVSSQNFAKEEADMLLAGILLDTKQFTRNTGTRTFGAAQYLRGAGAEPTDVYELFKTDPRDLSKEARFHTAIVMYHGNIAISACDGDADESYRVIASKAADKMLTLRGVEAAFTLVRIGDAIHISGRSCGTINVQLILEKLHGGGHFDVAGAQVSADSTLAVVEMLKTAIDDYFDN